MKATIAALDPGERRAQEDALFAGLAACRALPRPGASCCSWRPFRKSRGPRELFALAYAMKKIVLCPRVDRRARRLSLHRIADPASDLSPGVLGIPEPRPGLPEVAPATVDWALVPGLAFDERGFRLGRGPAIMTACSPCCGPMRLAGHSA